MNCLLVRSMGVRDTGELPISGRRNYDPELVSYMYWFSLVRKRGEDKFILDRLTLTPPTY